MFNLGFLRPATPVFADMLGARIEYNYAQPYASAPIIESGTIIRVYELRGVLHMEVKPDNPARLTKWVRESAFRRYVHSEGKATA